MMTLPNLSPSLLNTLLQQSPKAWLKDKPLKTRIQKSKQTTKKKRKHSACRPKRKLKLVVAAVATGAVVVMVADKATVVARVMAVVDKVVRDAVPVLVAVVATGDLAVADKKF
jgi:hypothetical protein